MDIPKIFNQFNGIIAAQTSREHPFRLPQQALTTNDLNISEEENELNKSHFLKTLGINENQIAYAKQIHDDAIAIVEWPIFIEGFDALITAKKNVFILVSIADCTPVLIYDSHNNAVAAIHAGWRGTVKKIVSKTLQAMNKQFGTIGKNCFAYIGTCISEYSFEVGAEVAQQFNEQFVIENNNKLFVNLKSANQHQLLQFGIPAQQIETSQNCTVINNDSYFSFRYEKGKTGRMFALIGVK